jgi:hypothetical protein
MTSRREFLQTGVAVSALTLPLEGFSTSAKVSDGPSIVPLGAAVVDPRYAEGRTFARAVGRLGVPIRALEGGDVTKIYQDFDLAWRNRPAAIAGLTQFGPMFVLEQLANERGMRVAARFEHQLKHEGTLTHQISAPLRVVELAERLCSRGFAWPTIVAAVVTSFDGRWDASVTKVFATTGSAPVFEKEVGSKVSEPIIHYYRTAAIQQGHDVPFDGPLFSWVIMPRARA